MNKLIQKKVHINKLLLFSFVINAAILLFYLLLIQPTYEMADDYGYSDFITNGYTNIKFSSFFLFEFIKFVQNIIYPFNAYTIVNIALSYIAFVVITIIFCDKFNYAISLCTTIVINGFFAVNHYSTISFTRMAALLSVAGFLCVLNYIQQKNTKIMIFMGFLLMLCGSMYRFEVYEVAVIVFFVFIISFEIINVADEVGVKNKVNLYFKRLFERKRLIIGLSMVALCFLTHYLSNYINTSTDELKYYNVYTSARSAVWDYKPADYDSSKEDYDQININENDLNMLGSGYMDDEGAFSLNNLWAIRAITNISNEKSVSELTNLVLDSAKNEVLNFRGLGDKGILYFFYAIVFIFILVFFKKRYIIVPICFLFIAVPFYLYLWITGKCPFRAVYVIWLSAIIYSLYSIDFNNLRKIFKEKGILKNKYIKTVVFVLCLILGGFSFRLSCIGNYTFDAYKMDENDLKCAKYIDSQKDTKFEISRNADVDMNVYYNNLDIYHTARVREGSNYISFSCTYYRLPYYDGTVEDFNTNNLYSNLLNDDVVFISKGDDSTVFMFEKYLEKYYANSNDVKYDIVNEIGDYQFVKFYE